MPSGPSACGSGVVLSCYVGPDPIEIAWKRICSEVAMAPIKAGSATVGARRAWQAPVATQLPIGAETKSAHNSEGNPAIAEPKPPAPPATKLGFSFEMAMPLAARTEK